MAQCVWHWAIFYWMKRKKTIIEKLYHYNHLFIYLTVDFSKEREQEKKHNPAQSGNSREESNNTCCA